MAGLLHTFSSTFLQLTQAQPVKSNKMGLFAAFAYLFPYTELYIMFIPVPIKAKWAVALMVALDLFGQFGPVKTGIGHYAHLSGLVTGFLLVLYWNKNNKKTFY